MNLTHFPRHVDASEKLGLQVLSELVQSAKTAEVTSPTMNGSGVVDPLKVAAVLDDMCSSIEDLRRAHMTNAKIAASLIEAVKLAQDRVIDVEDILSVAKRALEDGSVKLSALNELADSQLGDLAGDAQPKTDGLDMLTSYLRRSSARR